MGPTAADMFTDKTDLPTDILGAARDAAKELGF
jgi:hypothetical protein